MKLIVQACWEGGQTVADQVVQTLREAAQMRVVDLASSPLNPAAVEELIEAGVPMTGASWENWLAVARQVRREMLSMDNEAQDVLVLLIDRPCPRRPRLRGPCASSTWQARRSRCSPPSPRSRSPRRTTPRGCTFCASKAPLAPPPAVSSWPARSHLTALRLIAED